MSTTCTNCGADVQTDNEIQQEIIDDMINVVAIPIETLEAWQLEIQMLDEMVKNNTPHDDRSNKLTAIALSMLKLALKTD